MRETFIKRNLSDTDVLQAVILSLVLAFAHVVQYVRSGITAPLVYGISSFIAVIIMLIGGKKYMPYYLFAVSVVYIFFNRFTDCSSFIVILACCFSHPKLKKPYVVFYLCTFIVYMIIDQKEVTHALIHLSRCGLFYLADTILDKHIKTLRPVHPPLDVTPDEIIILDQLAEGMEVKEIREFCENTVYSKLKDCRNRNGISRNSELVERYRESNH